MCKSGKIFLIIVAVCSLFIFTGSRYAFAAEGGHSGGGERISEPVIERGNEGVSRQVIEDEAIRRGYYRNEDVPIVDGPSDSVIINENNDPDNNDSDDDDDYDDRVSDQ